MSHHGPRTVRLFLTGALVAAVVASTGLASSATADDGTPAPSGTPSAPSTPGAGGSTTPADPPSGTPEGSPSDAGTPSDTPSAPATETPKKAAADGPTLPSCGKCPTPPDRYTPANGTIFNYPYSSTSYKDRIRTHVLRSIRAVGWNGRIRIAMYSINDDATVDALIAAVRRHASVQVLVNQHNVRKLPGKTTSPSFIRLMRTLGTRTSAHDGHSVQEVSWAKICDKSCRGLNGNVHQKMVLITAAGGNDGQAAKYITMMGSPNLTMLAARGQWNHFNTYLDTNQADGYPLWSRYMKIFREMAYDRPVAYQEQYSFQGINNAVPIQTWFYPKPNTRGPSSDPLYVQMRDIRCTGPSAGYGHNGRTVIRIGQYAWFEEHGDWMARLVRQLWEQGCDIAVETAVMGNNVKRILLSSAGRGRIPVRQVGTFAKDGTTLTYDHAKWVAVNGVMNHCAQSNPTGSPKPDCRGQIRVWTGTMNWTNLGFSADEGVQLYSNQLKQDSSMARSNYYKYIDNFNNIWSGPHSFSPSPASRISGDIGAGKVNQLGQGKYARVEDN